MMHYLILIFMNTSFTWCVYTVCMHGTLCSIFFSPRNIHTYTQSGRQVHSNHHGLMSIISVNWIKLRREWENEMMQDKSGENIEWVIFFVINNIAFTYMHEISRSILILKKIYYFLTGRNNNLEANSMWVVVYIAVVLMV